jgi:sugar-specific transcriptional regulator TrmB
LSLERVIKALERLGLTRVEAEVYVFTAKNGSQTILELCKTLNYSKRQVNSTLKTLIEQTLITKKGTNYQAIPFEKTLELLIEREKQQTQFVQERKEELLANWSKEK